MPQSPELKTESQAPVPQRLCGRRAVVTVVYKTLPRYRIPFFEQLRPYLADHNVDFRLVYGDPPPEEREKEDTGHIIWGQYVRNRTLAIGNRRVYWQPCLTLLKDSDLVIVEQASKLLVNYVLLAWQFLGGAKVAFWGHGRNFQTNKVSPIGEAVKMRLSRYAHWCFAYNESSAQAFRCTCFPSDRITVVQNAIDTTTLSRKRTATTETDIQTLRSSLGICGSNIAIFVGGLYAEKRVDFLIEAAKLVRARIPDFELVVLGGGPDQHIAAEAAQGFPWIHYVGPTFGHDKVKFFSLAKCMLLPGVVGLGVVDSFAFEVPLITIALPNHGPEIEYLVHGVNGLKCKLGATPAEYAEAVASVLANPDLRARLQRGCRQAAQTYTVEVMVEKFGQGVLQALAFPSKQKSSKLDTESRKVPWKTSKQLS